MNKFNDTHQRTIAKSVTWRVLLTIVHFINGFIATGSWVTAAAIISITTITNSIYYWLHERGWNYFNWRRELADKVGFFDKKTRTICKLLTWRVLISTTTFLTVLYVSGSVQQGLVYISLGILTNMIIFYVHERLWDRLKWGKTIEVKEQEPA